ncbi:MAG: radical SAM protein [Ruminococcaceae bacterium]|nr:radical SAM protein [Oscillospiraceae bacterium]
MDSFNVKQEHLKQLSQYRKSIIHNPPLRNLFLELTLRCNERCIHCGSSCGQLSDTVELSLKQYKKILDNIKRDFDISKIKLDITGGEPLLRKDFFDIMKYADKLGYIWGMTSNGTLINDEVAKKLQKCGMRTIAISIDGLEETHDRLRGRKDAFKSAMSGVNALIRNGNFDHIQITTVINHQNINELPQLFEIFMNIGIDSWRIINIEPMGRAKEHPELVLKKDEYRYMFNFIREKRLKGYPLTYGCSHFLGLEYERAVRDWYFLCNAGFYTASITANGNIVACLDIERRPGLIQGNILKDSFKEIWENGFKMFRTDLSNLNENCGKCSECDFCHGGAYHSWDYDRNEPMVCFKNVLF